MIIAFKENINMDNRDRIIKIKLSLIYISIK